MEQQKEYTITFSQLSSVIKFIWMYKCDSIDGLFH